jgi:hypothetical protein
MDLLIADDMQTSRRTPPAEKLVQAFEMAEAGVRLKRAALRHASPAATEQEVDAALERWLLTDA